MTKELNQYYREVRSHLFCPKGEQDHLLAKAHQMVEELRESNPDLDYSGVVEFLGEPQELASTFMECMDPAMVEGYKKKKKRIRISIVAFVAALIAALSIFSIYVVQLKSEAQFTYSEDLVIEDDTNEQNEKTE